MNRSLKLAETISVFLEGTPRQEYHKTCAGMHLDAAKAHDACGTNDPSQRAITATKKAHAYTLNAVKKDNQYDGRNTAKAKAASEVALDNSQYDSELTAKSHREAAAAHNAAAKNRVSEEDLPINTPKSKWDAKVVDTEIAKHPLHSTLVSHGYQYTHTHPNNYNNKGQEDRSHHYEKGPNRVSTYGKTQGYDIQHESGSSDFNRGGEGKTALNKDLKNDDAHNKEWSGAKRHSRVQNTMAGGNIKIQSSKGKTVN